MHDTQKIFLQQINENKGIIHKVAKMYMDNPLDQEDLFQEIVMQLWKAYPSFKGTSKFSTWMYRVALNTAIVFFKKDHRKVDKASLNEQIEIADFSDSHEKEEKLAYLYKAVQELNQIEKALIFLFLENQSHREIAQNLGITEVNARVKLNRTKEKLQQIIKKNGYEF
ncbi:RNA polymerase sigma factor [Pedobacter chitinilyticus]|uniref:Sigma-70 family RNA polymerase sigma factor n=1 Tax=Pedobacter chitinilyticus TaxID=2233776 RepID=A0A443Z0T5_9SPHI|nr:sigma-70 family RNA polymerase sigma factor [Pedobacter chitinilyticus]RWU10108.1 sigma-70 family RNA polymerase sigma factor [Pedobacter chitinilyticus]